MKSKFILWFNKLSKEDIEKVGGKNASLGELSSKLKVPTLPGFAVNSDAYNRFLEKAGLRETIRKILIDLDTNNIKELSKRGKQIRDLIEKAEVPRDIRKEIVHAYRRLGNRIGVQNPYVAVRSSATAEDLPGASFAGQQETYLNIEGERDLLKRYKNCVASLFTDRAISYRVDRGFDHLRVSLSVGVQKMGRSDIGASGVMFTIDPDSGFDNVVVINGSYGLGEYVVQGKVIPDEFVVFKPTMKLLEKELGRKNIKLVRGGKGNIDKKVSSEDQKKFCISDEQAYELARHAIKIEKHYKAPMDIEWILDGETGKIYIVQARPETVHSVKKTNIIREHVLKEEGKVLTTGLAVGRKIGQGRVNVLKSPDHIHRFRVGEVLVTDMTDPDWEPIMKMASAIVTDKGGKTCFEGKTKVLTDKGFITMEEGYQRIKDGEKLFILAYDYKEKKPVWKKIVDTSRIRSDVIRISVSQTGRMEENYVDVTRDHKMYTFNGRSLIKKRIDNILKDDEHVCLINSLPRSYSSISNNKLAYLAGAILSDGHVRLNKRRGGVFFTQKETPEKEAFITTVNEYFTEIFDESFTPKLKTTKGYIRGRCIQGTATDYVCQKKKPAIALLDIYNNLVPWVLNLNEDSCFNFLAGLLDGDGSFYNNRLYLYVGKENVVQGVICCCLRLGIMPQVTRNRNIYNIQIVERMNEILRYTKRLNGKVTEKKLGTNLFSAKQLFSDIIGDVNYKGRIKTYVNNNLLIDTRKIRDYILPLLKNPILKKEVQDILNSNLRMNRVKQTDSFGETYVYNFEVEGIDELEHNFIAFTSKYSPLLVSNSHAAIVSRELGVPCIIGSVNATKVLKNGQEVTVDCSSGVGKVFKGFMKTEVIEKDIDKIPRTKTKIMINIGEPSKAFSLSKLPVDGVGLVREEFIISSSVGEHPLHLLNTGQGGMYVDALAKGIGKIAAAFYPRPVVVRLSDFKSDEYSNLNGGEDFEPTEDNPMIGWRGASRYTDKVFYLAFELECRALKKVREEMGLTNVIVMVPFCRTPEEGKEVLKIMSRFGLNRKRGMKFFVMAEIPSNIILAEEYAKIFDGFSIGSNDLTQLTLGLDRNSQRPSYLFDERHKAVKRSIEMLVEKAHKNKPRRPVGICGEAPSNYPDFTEFLVRLGLDSISVEPDMAIKTILLVNKLEKKMGRK